MTAPVQSAGRHRTPARGLPIHQLVVSSHPKFWPAEPPELDVLDGPTRPIPAADLAAIRRSLVPPQAPDPSPPTQVLRLPVRRALGWLPGVFVALLVLAVAASVVMTLVAVSRG